MFEFLGKLFSIIERFVPGRMEQYHDELKRLEVVYAKALATGNDTDAAVARKRMEELRAKLGIKDGE